MSGNCQGILVSPKCMNPVILHIILSIKDSLQQQIHYNGKIFGNKCCHCNEGSLYILCLLMKTFIMGYTLELRCHGASKESPKRYLWRKKEKQLWYLYYTLFISSYDDFQRAS